LPAGEVGPGFPALFIIVSGHGEAGKGGNSPDRVARIDPFGDQALRLVPDIWRSTSATSSRADGSVKKALTAAAALSPQAR
jgi:hypothetical protein